MKTGTVFLFTHILQWAAQGVVSLFNRDYSRQSYCKSIFVPSINGYANFKIFPSRRTSPRGMLLTLTFKDVGSGVHCKVSDDNEFTILSLNVFKLAL